MRPPVRFTLAASCCTAAALALAASVAQDEAPRAEAVSGFEVVPEIGAEDPKSSPGEDAVSRSRSRQFEVHAKESRVRGAFCVFAEEVKTDFLTLLQQPDKWRYPVVIKVTGHSTVLNRGAAVRPSIVMVEGGGYRLVASVEIGDAFTREAMRKELITLLLAEQILRTHPSSDFKGRKVLPDWLRIGVSEAVDFRDRDRPTELFAAIFKSGKMLSVHEIISARPDGMNSVSEAIYRASCCGLVLAMLEQDFGPKRLRALIGDLAVFRGSQAALLEKHFPGTGDSKHSIEKWWALELATMAQPTVKDILEPLESEEALGRCLQVRYVEKVEVEADPAAGEDGGGGADERRRVWQILRPRKAGRGSGQGEGGDGAPELRSVVHTADLSEYRKFLGRDDRAQLLGAVEVALLQLSYRAFPLHRPMIKEYQSIIIELGEGETKGLEERFARLAAQRVELARAARDATDFLHHYQATKVGRLSGAFEEYREAVDELNRPLPPRTDPLSKYLDALDKEYH